MDKPLAFIIEDDKVISEIFDTAVVDAGYETKVLRDGKRALQELEINVPHLVVLDLHLPNVPGVRILQHIRQDERYQDCRVIVVSADATLTTFLRESADLVLVKPIGFYQLREMALRLHPDMLGST